MDNFRLYLQIFADGGAAGGDGGAAAAAGGDTGVQAPDAGVRNNRRRRENPLANVQYGIQEGGNAQQVAPAEKAAAQGEGTEESFENLIKGKYKADFDSHVQSIIQQRFKKNADNEAMLESYKPLMEAIGKKFNVDPTDIDGMIDAIIYDEDELDEEAMRLGMSRESVKIVNKLKRENEKYKAQEQKRMQDEFFANHYANLQMQAEKLKEKYPGIDLQKELENPVFKRLTGPGNNVPVEQAYFVIHKDEILQANAQAQAERMSKAIQANGARPTENGLKGNQGAATVKTDPRTLTPADRAEIRRRAARGEKVVF